eukprot:6202170-Pleurochrysis_carterae.AAC.1
MRRALRPRKCNERIETRISDASSLALKRAVPAHQSLCFARSDLRQADQLDQRVLLVQVAAEGGERLRAAAAG